MGKNGTADIETHLVGFHFFSFLAVFFYFFHFVFPFLAYTKMEKTWKKHGNAKWKPRPPKMEQFHFISILFPPKMELPNRHRNGKKMEILTFRRTQKKSTRKQICPYPRKGVHQKTYSGRSLRKCLGFHFIFFDLFFLPLKAVDLLAHFISIFDGPYCFHLFSLFFHISHILAAPEPSGDFPSQGHPDAPPASSPRGPQYRSEPPGLLC